MAGTAGLEGREGRELPEGMWEEDHAFPAPHSHLSVLLLCHFSQFHKDRQRSPRNGQWDEGSHPLGAAGTLCVRSEHPEITLESTNIKYLQDQGMAGIGRDPKLLSLPLPWTRIIPIIPGLSYPKALMKYPSEQKRFF